MDNIKEDSKVNKILNTIVGILFLAGAFQIVSWLIEIIKWIIN